MSRAAPPALFQKKGEISGRNWVATAKATSTPAHLLPSPTGHGTEPRIPCPSAHQCCPRPGRPQKSQIRGQNLELPETYQQNPEQPPRPSPALPPEHLRSWVPVSGLLVAAHPLNFQNQRQSAGCYRDITRLLSYSPPSDQLASLYSCYTRCIFIVSLQQKIYGVFRLSV